MSSYRAYGNIFVDSSNNGGLGGTLSITNSCNTATLGNQASIAFDVANVPYSILGQGLIQSGVDIAGARISAVIDRVTPAVGTALVMNVSGNSLLPPTEAIRISSNGNVGIGVQVPQYALDVSNTGIRSTQILSNGIKTTSVVAVSNPTNVAGADFVIGQGTSSTATTVHAQNNIFIGNPPTALTTSGRFNVGVGNQSLTSLSVGGNNVAVGYLAGNALTTGAYNTAIGANAFSTGSTFNFSTAIGYNSAITGNNQISMGTAAENVFIPGQLNFFQPNSSSTFTGGGMFMLAKSYTGTGITSLNTLQIQCSSINGSAYVELIVNGTVSGIGSFCNRFEYTVMPNGASAPLVYQSTTAILHNSTAFTFTNVGGSASGLTYRVLLETGPTRATIQISGIPSASNDLSCFARIMCGGAGAGKYYALFL